tara:strand:- start:11039 stop:11668 length:630 start_codon:yes stop_codon:yes gene_type:complete
MKLIENRIELINYFIEKNNYINYLEIGVRHPFACFNKINSPHKDGVDPVPHGKEVNYPITSDDFFKLIKGKDIKYDIIFIDGLHLYEQSLRDIKNALNHITEKGTIIIHDCNPPTEKHQTEIYDGESAWNGTVWKALVECRCTMSNINIHTLDTDWGLGIIQLGKQDLWTNDKLEKCHEYSYLEENRKELLNLISKEEFNIKYKTGYEK